RVPWSEEGGDSGRGTEVSNTLKEPAAQPNPCSAVLPVTRRLGPARLLLTLLPIPVGIRWLPAIRADEIDDILLKPTGQGTDLWPQRVRPRPLLKRAEVGRGEGPGRRRCPKAPRPRAPLPGWILPAADGRVCRKRPAAPPRRVLGLPSGQNAARAVLAP